jgi:hypothetical protein
LKENDIVMLTEGEEESSSDDDESDEDSDTGDEMETATVDIENAEPRENVAADLNILGQAIVEETQETQDKQVCSSWVFMLDLLKKICQDALRTQASAFMGRSKDNTRSAEDVISTPLPGETLAMFYTRSRECPFSPLLINTISRHIPGEFWTQKAHGISDNRGKLLRRDGFGLAEDRYGKIYADFLCGLGFTSIYSDVQATAR